VFLRLNTVEIYNNKINRNKKVWQHCVVRGLPCEGRLVGATLLRSYASSGYQRSFARHKKKEQPGGLLRAQMGRHRDKSGGVRQRVSEKG